MNFAQWFKKELDASGINATQFAEAIKENQPTIQRILSGETQNPRLKIVKKIEDYFNRKFEQDKPSDTSIIVAGIKIDSNEKNLIDMYRALSSDSQNTIDLLANRLFVLEHPGNRKAQPFTKKKTVKS
jgi:transcriptional regulator with XRE-family HTH domain